MTDICAWMSSDYRKGKLLSGIIYLHRITDVRIDGSSLKYVKMFQRLCGPDALQNVLLTTTQWSNVNPILGAERETHLRHVDFWGGLLAKGASLERFMGTRESGLELICKLIAKEPKPLHIQDQMVEKGMTLVETDAGKFTNAQLISLQKIYEKDIAILEGECQNGVEGRDKMKGILAQEQAKAQEKLEAAAAERELLEDSRKDEMEKKREEAEREKARERERNDRAVIAVDWKDINPRAHFVVLFKSYNIKGRLIYDISDMKEFQKDPVDIRMEYQWNISSIPYAITETLSGMAHNGVDSNNYVVHNGDFYWFKPDGRITIGTQNFHIFIKY